MGLLGVVRHGRALRHLPITWTGRADVRVVAVRTDGTSFDASDHHAILSLRPLLLGIEHGAGLTSLVFIDNESGRRVAEIAIRDTGDVLGGPLPLTIYRATGTRHLCVGAMTRWWRYALAWRHAQRSRARGDLLEMTARDLLAFDAYSTRARRSWLIGSADGGEATLFPVTILSRIGERVIVPVPASSVAASIIKRAGVFTISETPADALAHMPVMYELHHSNRADLADVPFPVAYGEPNALPRLAAPAFVATAEVEMAEPQGNDAVFVARIIGLHGEHRPQLAYLSELYAAWRAKQGNLALASAFIRG